MFNFFRSCAAAHSVNLSIKGALSLQSLGTDYRQKELMAGRSLGGCLTYGPLLDSRMEIRRQEVSCGLCWRGRKEMGFSSVRV